MAKKATTPSSNDVVISKASETSSKKRTLDDGSKGKQVAPLSEAKKIKAGSVVHAASARPPVVLGEGSSARLVSRPSSFGDGQCCYGREDSG